MSTHHVVPLRIYYFVFVSLLVLTGLTVGVAFLDLGPLNTIVALAIAALKAALVVLWFMHVRYSARLIWVVFASAIFWLALLFALTFSDYWTRGWLPGLR